MYVVTILGNVMNKKSLMYCLKVDEQDYFVSKSSGSVMR